MMLLTLLSFRVLNEARYVLFFMQYGNPKLSLSFFPNALNSHIQKLRTFIANTAVNHQWDRYLADFYVGTCHAHHHDGNNGV